MGRTPVSQLQALWLAHRVSLNTHYRTQMGFTLTQTYTLTFRLLYYSNFEMYNLHVFSKPNKRHICKQEKLTN